MKKRKINYRHIFWSFIALFLGVSFAKPICNGEIAYIFSSLVGFAFLFYIFYKYKIKVLYLCLVFMFGMGIYFADFYLFVGKDYKNNYTISGRVCDVLYNGIVLDNCVVETDNIKLLIYTEEKFEVGDIIIFSSNINKVDMYKNGYFNSILYRYGVSHTANLSTYEIIKNNKTLAESFRENVKTKLYEVMNSETASICYAVLFGDKSELDYGVNLSFKNAGIAHLLAVSGLHIGFFSAFLFFLLKFLKNRYVKFVILFVMLGIYCYLCSFTPSVLRASLMCLMLFSSEMLAKPYDQLTCIGICGILILLFAPLFALDLGFRLSFLCVISIFVLYKSIYKFLRKLKIVKFVAISMAISLSIQLGILPFMFNVFGEIAIFSIITNLIAIPIFQIAYTLLMLGLVFSFISPVFYIILTFSEILIYIIQLIASFVSSIPFAVILVFPLGTFITLAYYGCLFIWSRFVNIEKVLKIKICTILLLSSFLLTLFV